MRFSPASRLHDRQLVWVGYRNDGTAYNRHWGHDCVIWSQQYAEAYADDVKRAAA